MGWPEGQTTLTSLAGNKVHRVELLGHRGNLKFTQEPAGLAVQLPPEKPGDYAVTLKIALA